MTFLGQNSISDLRLGDSQVQAAYLGNEQIWHREQPAADYWGLCFTAEEPDATVSMKANGSAPSLDLLYSTDSQTWSIFTPGTTTVTLANVGDKVWLKAAPGGNSGTGSSSSNYWKFSFTNHVAASGNIMSLLNGEQQTYEISQDYAFSCLFQQTNIIHAAELQLPATPLTAQGIYYDMFYQCSQLVGAPDLQAEVVTGRNCYSGMFNGCTSLSTPPQIFATAVNSDQGPMQQMFRGCTSLTSAPALPAMVLGSSCYSQMFRGCTSLSSAPELPATTLRYGCYSQMFRGCTSLSSAPELPATTLTAECYYNMFNGCTKLAYISAAFTEWNPSNATTGWVTNVSSSGTFYCPTALGTNDTITRGDNYCPTNWTVVNTDA